MPTDYVIFLLLFIIIYFSFTVFYLYRCLKVMLKVIYTKELMSIYAKSKDLQNILVPKNFIKPLRVKFFCRHSSEKIQISKNDLKHVVVKNIEYINKRYPDIYLIFKSFIHDDYAELIDDFKTFF